MLTGHNTEVLHGGHPFHVQTEEKGVGNPQIETRIYLGGEIITCVKSSYADLVEAGAVDESVIRERMDSQHRDVVAGVERGDYDALVPEPADRTPLPDRPFEDAVIEFLDRNAGRDILEMIIEPPPPLTFGNPMPLRLRVRLCWSRTPVRDAEVRVRLVYGPKDSVVLLTDRTDAEGRLLGYVTIPPRRPEGPATATVIVSCVAPEGTDEVPLAVR